MSLGAHRHPFELDFNDQPRQRKSVPEKPSLTLSDLVLGMPLDSQATRVQIGIARQDVLIVSLLVLAGLFLFLRGKRLRGVLASQPKARLGEHEETIAQIHSLHIYPIKGCGGSSLDFATFGTGGLEYDRKWIIVREDNHTRTGTKEAPKTLLIRPVIQRATASSPGLLHIDLPPYEPSSRISVPLDPSPETLASLPLIDDLDMYGDTCHGHVCASAVDSDYSPSECLSEYMGFPVLLLIYGMKERTPPRVYKPPPEGLKLYKGLGTEFRDLYPFLVTSVESLDEVQRLTELAAKTAAEGGEGVIGGINPDIWSGIDAKIISMRNFRPNIVLKSLPEPAGSCVTQTKRYPPFSEDSWSTIWPEPKPGAPHSGKSKGTPIHLVARCARCIMTTTDPDTGTRDPAVPLKVLTRFRMRTYQVPVEEIPGIKMAKSSAAGDGKVRNGACFGIYGVPQLESNEMDIVAVGDRVRVRWRPFVDDDEQRGRESAPISDKRALSKK